MARPPSGTSDHLINRHVFNLVASDTARSRVEIANALRLAPSTVGLRVQSLLDAGYLREVGDGVSRGGRRPRLLGVAHDAGAVLTVELGGSHARLGLHDLSGSLRRSVNVTADVREGPVATLAAVGAAIRSASRGHRLRAIGVSLPGPVDTALGCVTKPARMPGWAGFPVGDTLADGFGVPVAVGNDANLAAVGEHRAQFGASHHSITVKAGTGIGSGVVINGRLHRGATAAAGDIAHTHVDDSANLPCSCGNSGCLETVASGSGLARQMREAGRGEIRSTGDVIAAAQNADPQATALVRTAGTLLGQALAGVVNFFNPHALFLTGSLSACDPFIAAVRARVYEAAHPLVTQDLRIEIARTGADAVLGGAACEAIDVIEFSPA